jgi:hypothetical protein
MENQSTRNSPFNCLLRKSIQYSRIEWFGVSVAIDTFPITDQADINHGSALADAPSILTKSLMDGNSDSSIEATPACFPSG